MGYLDNEFRVLASDVNSDMKITNFAILGMMEDVGSLHADSAGNGYVNISEHHLSWIIMQWKVRILRRPAYGERLVGRTWVSGDKRVYAFRQYQFFDENGDVIIEASSKWVLNNTESGVVRIPKKVMDDYGVVDEVVFEEGNDMERISEPEDYSSVYDYTVPCTWIDVNGHMNNKFYIDVAYQALPIDVYMAGSFDGFDVMYKRECKLGDNLRCYYNFDGEKHTVSIKNAESGLLNAIVRLKQKED